MKKILIFSACFFVFCPFGSIPTSNAEEYRMPSKTVTDLILAPATPSFSASPKKDRYVIVYTDDIPTIKELSQEELRLAGTRILPATNGPKVRTKIKGFEMKSMPGTKDIREGKVEGFPDHVNIIDYRWSPDGKMIAACVEEEDGIRLWIIDVDVLKATKLNDLKVNMFFGTNAYEWSNDSKKILVTFVPENRGKEPVDKIDNTVPVIQESDGKKNPVRTYQDLLSDDFTERQFDYYATSVLGIIRIDDGGISYLGENAVYTQATFSPDGNYILIQSIERPYSYVVPYRFFPSVTEIRDENGSTIKVLAKTQLVEYEYSSLNSAFPGPRSYRWRPDLTASVCWIEPLDGGNGSVDVPFRDKVMCISSPFSEDAEEVYKGEHRINSILWGDANNAFVLLSDRSVRHKKCIHIDPQKNVVKQVVYDLSSEDLYADPGTIIMTLNSLGRSVVYTPDNYKNIYFSGRGYSPKGAYPFIDEYNIAKNRTRRIWQCQDPYFESPVTYIDLVKGKFISRRESNDETPNYYLVNIKEKNAIALTRFENPYPSMTGVSKQVIKYTRKDGVKLSGTLYLPAGYKKENGTLPVLMWAYPSEFKSSDNAGQRSDAPNQFTRYTRTSPILWVAEGYAVLNNASFPIIGEGDKEPNDTYIEQLVSNAEAAIDILVEMGIADRKRIAVGGHSYGAFMTANLLANSDLFAAGIARSGAYNRTLTPFGFQNERRSFWEAPDVYLTMSPFVKADKLKTPILLIHGLADNNTGTFTVQSERLYTALKGNGGIVRLVLLPYESHSYVAKESILHQAWETWQWLEKYVKNR